ncbi:GAF and ANTAR domain-containing protein [Arthrobacter sp. NEB 688]|uniref:GAF and ANTAR domain-containing protein n=1 Tax=Arthrobacter sp. NEB 688 TaxID=904039 RepID=UPI001564DA2A|nr:GAF and ANTAR domain-containing protein [Arthrobacter sp. NEB 688]QKE82557.1 GAF and ANTAR domain-containing protein [Arthrobacter sp. NEB 688]
MPTEPTAAPTEGPLDLVAELLAAAPADDGRTGTRRLLGALVARSADLVHGAEWCSITVMRSESLTTLATSHDDALAADQVQYELGSGPCVDAVVEDHVFRTGAVQDDPRWPEYGQRVHREVGVTSVHARRLVLPDGNGSVAALNLYATAPDAFDERSERDALLLATQCSLLVSAYLAHERAEHLEKALTSNREIGVAVGVLMAAHRVPHEEAFAMLRLVSQDTNRKIRDLAAEVARTGELPRPTSR